MLRSIPSNTRFTRPSAALVVACLALLVAMGGTGYASGLITGKQVKNSSLTGKDIKDATLTGNDVAADALTGADVDEAGLGAVPQALSAGSAERLGRLGAEDVLTVDGCQVGKLHGSVQIKTHGGNVPATYQQHPTWIDNAYSCNGGAVQVRRQGIGMYDVKFLQNPADLAFVQVRTDGSAAGQVCSSLDKIDVAGLDLNAFEVRLFSCSMGASLDRDFALMLP